METGYYKLTRSWNLDHAMEILKTFALFRSGLLINMKFDFCFLCLNKRSINNETHLQKLFF